MLDSLCYRDSRCVLLKTPARCDHRPLNFGLTLGHIYRGWLVIRVACFERACVCVCADAYECFNSMYNICHIV